jgi:phosphoribosylaminoimidazole (AIR) synthetase
MGVGFCIVCPSLEVDRVVKISKKRGVEAFEFGEVLYGEGVRIGGLRVS